jgi:hypothetical protein
MIVRFDDSLPILARVVAEELGEAALLSGVALRDATGRLAFFSGVDLNESIIERLANRLRADLGPYARADRVVAAGNDFGVQTIIRDASALNISVEEYRVRLIDRRLVGADWLRAPSLPAAPPPRFVFASLKGGVGRSTALSVAAADLASRGRRVLAIDLDMEAPGIGAMLLDEGTLPEFGLIDALVENGLAPLDDAFLTDLVGPSMLADRRGRIDVVPAFGRRSLRNPGDILAKIARAYAENVSSDGSVATILDQVRSLVDRLSDPTRYDAILVDVRAGLHETTASAILGLGADVFLFGLDECQTFQGYRALLAHLGRFVDPRGRLPEWLDRLTMVQGKAPADPELRAAFVEQCRKLFTEFGLGPRQLAAAVNVPLPADPFRNVPWNDDDEISDEDLALEESSGPREPLSILDDERFRLFEPTRKSDLLSENVYKSSFGLLIDRINESFVPDEGNHA